MRFYLSQSSTNSGLLLNSVRPTHSDWERTVLIEKWVNCTLKAAQTPVFLGITNELSPRFGSNPRSHVKSASGRDRSGSRRGRRRYAASTLARFGRTGFRCLAPFGRWPKKSKSAALAVTACC